jgi:hypothetical protein
MASRSLLPEAWKVPEVFRSRVRHSVGRQRAMFADGHLLLVLHEPPKPDQKHRNPRLFWRSPDGNWQSNSLGPGIAALTRHINEYQDLLDKLDKAEDQAERADDYFGLMRKLAPLHRTAGNLHNALCEAREMVREDHELVVCRDQAYQAYRSAELLQSDAKIGLDCAIARRAEEQSESSYKMALAGHRLNVLVAVFFPIATIATIFGMNIDPGLGETNSPRLFWALVLGSVVCGFFLWAAIIGRPSRPPREDLGKKPGR